jgi:hypothetical protein
MISNSNEHREIMCWPVDGGRTVTCENRCCGRSGTQLTVLLTPSTAPDARTSLRLEIYFVFFGLISLVRFGPGLFRSRRWTMS